LQTETLSETLEMLMKLPKICFKSADFNPTASLTLLRLLKGLVELVGTHYPVGADLKINFIVFLSSVVRMDNKSGYERVSDQLQVAAVELVSEMARVDPDGTWCRWEGAVHNICALGI
jgi:hypothetical protein